MVHRSGFPTLFIAGLAFRHYQGEQDLPAMLEVFLASQRADQEDVHATLADFTNQYRHLTNCDPYQDVLIAEVNGRMVAFGRVEWREIEASGGARSERHFMMEWYIHPDWRGQGLERAFLCQSQERLRQIIRAQAGRTSEGETPESATIFRGARLFEAHATDLQTDMTRLLEEDGFQAVIWGSKMTCTNLQNIAEVPMPEGLEVHPIKPEHYRRVWDAMLDGFRDHPDFSQPGEEDYAAWLESSQFQPALWQVGWEGDQIVGMVLNYTTHDPAKVVEPRTAWTEDICVRPPWRRRGLARALLARSMRMFREMGFTQTSLGVDIKNPHGARQLYEAMGYRLVNLFIIYRKPVDPS